MAERARGYACVVYPESAPENWREILDEQHIPWVESPLHEFDFNPTGELKKPHYHIVFSFEGVKSIDQIKKIIEPLHCTIPIKLHSIKGMVRYMAHLDNPEKYQYNPALIVGHGGVDVSDYLKISASARYSMMRDMIKYIRDKNITDYMEFMEYAMEQKYETWFPLLCDNSTYMIVSVIKANRQHMQDQQRRYDG